MKNLVLTAIVGIGATLMFSGCNSEVSGVKDGTLPAFSNSLTVGKALDGWSAQECTDKKWESVTTERGEKVVQFTCEVNVDGLKRQEDMAENISDDSYTKAQSDLKVAEDANTNASKKFDSMGGGDPDFTNAQAEVSNTYAAKESAYKAVQEIGEHLARKQVKNGKFVIQFLLSADGKSFEPGYSGIEYTFEDGKIYSEAFNALVAAYRNQKIELGISMNSYESRQ